MSDPADNSLFGLCGCSKEVIARKRLERSQNRDGARVDLRELAAKMTKFVAEESAAQDRCVFYKAQHDTAQPRDINVDRDLRLFFLLQPGRKQGDCSGCCARVPNNGVFGAPS